MNEDRITHILDTKSSETHYIVRKPDGTEFVKCSKANTRLGRLIDYFSITHIDDREVTEEDKAYVPNTSDI